MAKGFDPNCCPNHQEEPVNVKTFELEKVEECVDKGWLIKKGNGRCAKYYPTYVGVEQLKKMGLNL